MTNADKLTKLFRRVNDDGVLRDLKDSDRVFLNTLNPREIAEAQGNLIESGFSVDELSRTVSLFFQLGAVPDQVAAIKTQIANNHLLRYLLLEHELIDATLEDLRESCFEVLNLNEIKISTSEYRRLYKISQTLATFNRHMNFEDDVLFPAINQHCRVDFFEHFKAEHLFLNIAVKDLFKLVSNVKNYKIKDFKIRLTTITEYLCGIMNEHIFIEDNIIYPIILDSCTNKKVWEDLKKIREDMGYATL